MRWVPEQGELSCSVHYHTSDCPARLLFRFLSAVVLLLVVVEVVVVVLPSEWPRLESGRLDVIAIFQCTVLLLGLLTASC